MQINLQPQEDVNQIKSIESGADGLRLKIADTFYTNSLILTSTTIEMWNVSDVHGLSLEDFERLAALDREVIILGTGSKIVFPPQPLKQPLIARQIGLEIMDTQAACRTYNLLVADGRSVAAALILS